jgi:hypothetical protein
MSSPIRKLDFIDFTLRSGLPDTTLRPVDIYFTINRETHTIPKLNRSNTLKCGQPRGQHFIARPFLILAHGLLRILDLVFAVALKPINYSNEQPDTDTGAASLPHKMDLSKANIPVIDISPSNPNAPEQLLSAASKYGFVFIKNSPETGGISPKGIAKMFELSKEFFAAPVEVKQEVSIASNKAGKNHGWLSQGIEKLDPKTQKRADVKEYVRLVSSVPMVVVICIAAQESKLIFIVSTELSTWASHCSTTPSSNRCQRHSHRTRTP